VLDLPIILDMLRPIDSPSDIRKRDLTKAANEIAAELGMLCSKINERSEEFKRGRSGFMVSMRYKGYDDLADKLEHIVAGWEADKSCWDGLGYLKLYLTDVCVFRPLKNCANDGHSL
jgi:hypothetical protein